ncbi:MAG: lytic murein transglycosylase B [Parahaliea sp.]
MAKHVFLILTGLLCWPALVLASGDDTGEYGQLPAARILIDELVNEEGYDRHRLEKIVAAARRQQTILDAISRPAEKTKPWFEYSKIFLTEQRAREGREFFVKYRDTLSRAENETGVPAEIIVAIIGVETYYGRISGNYRVIDALTTLAFDYPPRAPFFTGELKNYLMLTQEQALDPLSLKGSYAGAMGYGQFMPSSYRAYAVDFDGDDLADIWTNPVDAIGSVANYFKRHGWRTGEPVVSAARLNKKADKDMPANWFNDGLKPRRTVADYIDVGLIPADKLDPQAEATAMQFDAGGGVEEYWIGLHNFYVITRYNHSAMYAMSVYQLAQILRQL